MDGIYVSDDEIEAYAKQCKDCRWYGIPHTDCLGSDETVCWHKKVAQVYAVDARLTTGQCGPSGRLFKNPSLKTRLLKWVKG